MKSTEQVELDRLFKLCEKRMVDLNLDQPYVKRLKSELREIEAQNEAGYFLDLYDKKISYPTNQNNLLTPYLLGIVKTFDINKDPVYVYGEMPDIDVDYLDIVRDHLKTNWAPKVFGHQYVCNIGAYGTFGLKSSFKDMARVHGLSRTEIEQITKRLPGKDDEGHALSFDKALELFPELKKYCEEHADMAKAVKKLIGRNRSMGKHAGGLIISNNPIADFVPLIKNHKTDVVSSAWPEGLNRQELGPVGLIKFDLLVIADLMRLAISARLIKERHGLSGICMLPGQGDWSDTRYKNDSKSLAMANIGDLRGIFQFDSQGIRALARNGGVDSFNDLVSYCSLFRPGPMQSGFHEQYIRRKTGQEEYTIHPLLKPILSSTYGLLCFQEQIMQVMNVAGGIPLKDCYVVVKAISKKKVKLFEKYKDQFIKTASINLGLSILDATVFWDQIERFAEYSFNLSHATAYCIISARLLYLKAHYPLEFYAGTLICEDKLEKIKEYKTEAEAHQVVVKSVDINKSKVKFSIIGDEIYYGFASIKGIGEEKAARIVENQPYTGFEDFLIRFGTDAKIVKALIALRAFKEAEPVILYKFYEHFADKMKAKRERRMRRQKTRERYLNKLNELLPGNNFDFSTFKEEIFQKWIDEYDIDEERELDLDTYTPEQIELREQGIEIGSAIVRKHKIWNRGNEIRKLWNQWSRMLFDDKTKAEQEKEITLKSFKHMEYAIDKKVLEELQDEKKSEYAYYGFAWRSRLEESPDYTGGHTFEVMRGEVEHGVDVFSVEIEISMVNERKSKKNGSTFYSVTGIDANGEKATINVWLDDWERWHPELVVGNLVKIRLRPPSGGYSTYTFDSPPRHLRWKLPKDKAMDYRIVVMKPAVQTQKSIVYTDDLINNILGKLHD